MKLSELEKALKASWNIDTSQSYLPERPSSGQCAVTALVIQDYFGGEIVRTHAMLPNGKLESHYFNRINGEDIDLTKGQFPTGTIIKKGSDTINGSTIREYALSFPDTVKRYNTLKERVEEFLNGA
jgi:hypothetical protein